jgi:DNA-binding transcriptional MerR regulator
MRTLASYLKVSDAAKLLGVTPKTLRNWDRSGKLKPVRNPANGYRLYCPEDIASFLSRLDEGSAQHDPAGGACVSEAR